ncbi:hypothetical protein ASPVEDRAFT_52588 [Aspergillus versicolor CBS 583.65]|uniref:Aminotransferase class I/classII large domain-containing protein n=1 Tax=Aspergillus versicolor CBS 583.65 TaxID=1036611 RepID=A0A1L9PJI9_ASPVE|nr:uncharacterized protein ASPVEDRAFT_52588 [Aspergillus versicolor CBS 583.65]OJJ01688.1 hypothetical protein ASPVEDRAFT_52588 [Aspergillus versicolor CBS 583.65]
MAGNVPFASLPRAPIDPMFILKARADSDKHPDKVDLGVGVYRQGDGGYYEFPAIKKANRRPQAKAILARRNIGHDYNPTTGIPTFVRLARQFMFGDSIASIQTVAGTGANRIAAAFLAAHYRSKDNDKATAYIGTPAWGNYFPLFAHAGLPTETYRYYNAATRQVDIDSTLQAAEQAPRGSIFVLQACCHNPTGADMTENEWKSLGKIIKERNHLAFFDVAYHGLGAPEDAAQDTWPVRHFAARGVNMLVCQSFSKNMGLYSERVGVLHVVCREEGIAERVQDVLRSLVRWEVSSAPGYGARLAEVILEDETLCLEWLGELASAAGRLVRNRERLYAELTGSLGAPGGWEHLVRGKGLFSLLGIGEEQVERLINEFHIYLPPNGRINVAGLNERNVGVVARAIDQVVRADR